MLVRKLGLTHLLINYLITWENYVKHTGITSIKEKSRLGFILVKLYYNSEHTERQEEGGAVLHCCVWQAPQQRHNLGKRRLVHYTEFIFQSDIMKISQKGQRRICMKSHGRAEEVGYNAGKLWLCLNLRTEWAPGLEQAAHRSCSHQPSLQGCRVTDNPHPGSVYSSPKRRTEYFLRKHKNMTNCILYNCIL